MNDPLIDQNKPFVNMCAWCQKENPPVSIAVKANEKKYNFSHGICRPHLEKMYAQMGKPIPNDILKRKALCQSLIDNPELIKAYSQGNFLPQQELKERLQKLANII